MQVAHVFAFEKYHLEHWTLNESSSLEALLEALMTAASHNSCHTLVLLSLWLTILRALSS